MPTGCRYAHAGVSDLRLSVRFRYRNTVALAAAAAAADNDDDNDGRWSPWFRPILIASRPATIAAFLREVSANY